MSTRVRTGLEVLAGQRFRKLSGLKIGLVTNPTGILPDLTSAIEALNTAPGVKLRALDADHAVTLANTSLASLTADDFRFV